MKSDSGKISIVDDDESIRRATRALLRSVGYQVETFASAELFLESDALRETDCLVLDVRMPGIDGLELQRRLNAAQSHIPIIFVTAHDDKSYRTTAMDAGAVNFFHKPFEANAFVAAVQAALRNSPSFEDSQPETTGAALLASLEPS
jgi:FixJ family two-component response regulator